MVVFFFFFGIMVHHFRLECCILWSVFLFLPLSFSVCVSEKRRRRRRRRRRSTSRRTNSRMRSAGNPALERRWHHQVVADPCSGQPVETSQLGFVTVFFFFNLLQKKKKRALSVTPKSAKQGVLNRWIATPKSGRRRVRARKRGVGNPPGLCTLLKTLPPPSPWSWVKYRHPVPGEQPVPVAGQLPPPGGPQLRQAHRAGAAKLEEEEEGGGGGDVLKS